MRFEADQIMDLMNSLSEGERNELLHRLKDIFQFDLSLTAEVLDEMPMEQLMPLRDVIRGYILTKKHVPNILEAHASIDTSKLPSKVSFGRFPEQSDHDD
jgi:hypothetical protein